MVAALRLGFLALLLAIWWLVAQNVPPGLFASPLRTVEAWWGLWISGALPKALLASLKVYLTGTGLAVVVGIAVGGAMGLIRPFGRTVDIYVHALAATPRVAFIPLIIAFLGLGFEAKTLIIFLGALMPIVLNTYSGVLNTDAELVEMARATGASRTRTLFHVVMPGTVPFLIAGVRLGATIGLINTVVAELYTAVTGLGGLLALYGNRFQMAEYLAVVLTLAMIGVSMTEGLRLAERRLLRWRREE